MDFRWPPSAEELEQSSAAEIADRLKGYLDERLNRYLAELAGFEPELDPAVPTQIATSFGAETAAERPIAAVSPGTARTFAAPGGDAEAKIAALSPVEEPRSADITDTTMSAAVADSETAFDEISSEGWRANIARLQALIEGLTEKVDWRITNVIGR
jgi:hypothetical protein